MRYDGYLLCSDMDLTLKNTDGTISKENQEAIRLFQKNGGRFTVVTGRNAAHIAEYGDAFVPNAPICALNGAHIYDLATKQELYRGTLPLDESVLPTVVDAIREKAEELIFFRVINDTTLADFSSPEEIEQNADLICNGQWCKVLTTWRSEEAALHVMHRFMDSSLTERFLFSRSWKTGLEFNARCDCKGAAALRLKEMLPDVRKLVCIGDYENDLSMIESADLGVAVANAAPAVLQIADMITVSNDEAALAALIASLPEL